jgi:hypothetical protein
VIRKSDQWKLFKVNFPERYRRGSTEFMTFTGSEKFMGESEPPGNIPPMAEISHS